ncbi:ATP-binding protein [Deinococcus yavapaiensis]|uniref:ATP-binding protein n=1 Tax=Deinococcus yavapaiensis TaxID=309889 RepID=UPI001475853E|nr:AAA family ATPase [Deinococcus yavapaiensis]
MSSIWRFSALGVAALHPPVGSLVLLERKTAGLLTILALNGPMIRSRAAGILWPDSRDMTARNNLTQLLRKLRLTTGEELVTSSSTSVLSLAPHLHVDALDALAHFEHARYEAFLTHDGELLAEFEYDDCPNFEEWLLTERDRWHDARRKALVALADATERSGDVPLALTHAQRLLLAEPQSEEAFVRVIKYQYLLGDRSLALETSHRLEVMLQREFGVEPLVSTKALIRTVQHDRGLPDRPSRLKRETPVSILRPPVLAGRERQWELMEDAWTRGQGIIVCGQPGVGKSRLMHEFASSKGRVLRFEARPGDQNVPYATYSRSWRNILRARPHLDLPEWVRREFSRLVPEVWDRDPPPLLSPADRIRFFDATAEIARLVSEDADVVVSDDLQYYDSASSELSMHIAKTFAPYTKDGGLVQPILAFRQGELPASMEAYGRSVVDAGLYVWIDVPPLDAGAVQVLLDGLGLPGAARHASRLASFSGGNPLYLLETVKHLYETAQLEADRVEDLPIPPKAAALINERLLRLSPMARHAAQAAAVLQSNFTVELIAEVLRAPLLECVDAWQELEAAQVIDGEQFAHDLIYEGVRQGMTDSMRAALHRSAARVLEAYKANPMRVAQQWLAGNAPQHAAPVLLRAGRAAEDALLLLEAERAYQHAVTLYQELHDDRGVFEAYLAFVRLAVRVRPLEHLPGLLETLGRYARQPEERAAVRAVSELAAAREC